MSVLGLSAQTESVYRVALGNSNWTHDSLLVACVAQLSMAPGEVAQAVSELSAAGLLRSPGPCGG